MAILDNKQIHTSSPLFPTLHTAHLQIPLSKTMSSDEFLKYECDAIMVNNNPDYVFFKTKLKPNPKKANHFTYTVYNNFGREVSPRLLITDPYNPDNFDSLIEMLEYNKPDPEDYEYPFWKAFMDSEIERMKEARFQSMPQPVSTLTPEEIAAAKIPNPNLTQTPTTTPTPEPIQTQEPKPEQEPVINDTPIYQPPTPSSKPSNTINKPQSNQIQIDKMYKFNATEFISKCMENNLTSHNKIKQALHIGFNTLNQILITGECNLFTAIKINAILKEDFINMN